MIILWHGEQGRRRSISTLDSITSLIDQGQR